MKNNKKPRRFGGSGAVRLTKRIAAFALCLSMLLMAQSCSTTEAWNNNSSFGEIMDAIKTDLFGEPQGPFNTISVVLPMREGFRPIADKSAFDSLNDDNMREAYERLEENIFLITSEQNDKGHYMMKHTRVASSLDSAQIYIVKEAVLADHPEAYWLTGDYTIGCNMHDGNYITMYSQFSYEEIYTGVGEISDAVEKIFIQIPDGATEMECEVIVHDALVNSITYDNEAAEGTDDITAFGIYGALVKKSAVCSGYARTAKLLLNTLGINCRIAEGVSNDSGHMWNQVRIDGEWYNLDVTWDDTITEGGMVYYNYFNITDEQLAVDHQVGENYSSLSFDEATDGGYTTSGFYNFKLEECTATAANYYIKNAVYISATNDDNNKLITDKMKELSRTRTANFYIRFSDDITCQAADLWLYSGTSKTPALKKSIALSNNSGLGSKIDRCLLGNLSTSDNDTWKHVYAIKIIYA